MFGDPTLAIAAVLSVGRSAKEKRPQETDAEYVNRLKEAKKRTEERAAYRKKHGLGAHSQPVVLTPKTGRNDLCPCNSGKKFKKCCEGK